MNHDDLTSLAVNHLGSDWIKASKKFLFEVCPSTMQRLVAHKGPQKDINNVKSCLNVLNEVGENIPRFVSHQLDELPPITFSSINVSCLLTPLSARTGGQSQYL